MTHTYKENKMLSHLIPSAHAHHQSFLPIHYQLKSKKKELKKIRFFIPPTTSNKATLALKELPSGKQKPFTAHVLEGF
jgi:hypothetical protein